MYEIKFFTKALMKIHVCWHATPCRLVNIESALFTEDSVQNAYYIHGGHEQDVHYIQGAHI